MKYAEILHRCFRCGYCKLPGNYSDVNCPAYAAFRFESYSPGGACGFYGPGWTEKSRLPDVFKKYCSPARHVEIV